MENMLGERHLVHCKTTAVEEKDVFEGWNRNTHTKKSKLRQKITQLWNTNKFALNYFQPDIFKFS